MDLKEIGRIYVISLPNSERKPHIKRELNKNFIWFNWYDAIENKEDGAKGLKDTFKKLFTECLDKGFGNVMVLEDDAVFTRESSYKDISEVLKDLPPDYHLCKFGANLLCPVSKITDNLNRIIMSFALHACLYSKEAMKLILQNIDNTDEPIDVIIAKYIEPLGYSYVSSKMIMTQRPSKSSIFVYDPVKHKNIDFYNPETEVIDWDKLMQRQWERNTNHLKQKVA